MAEFKYLGIDEDGGVLTCNVSPTWNGSYWSTGIAGGSLGLLHCQPDWTWRGELWVRYREANGCYTPPPHTEGLHIWNGWWWKRIESHETLIGPRPKPCPDFRNLYDKLRERVDSIHNSCTTLGPKQVIGELLAYCLMEFPKSTDITKDVK